MNEIEIERDGNLIYLKVNGVLTQCYTVSSSTFTIKRFPEENQVKFYMHTLGIDPSYYNHFGIDIYIKPGGTTSNLIINGQDCGNDMGTFLSEMKSIYQ